MARQIKVSDDAWDALKKMAFNEQKPMNYFVDYLIFEVGMPKSPKTKRVSRSTKIFKSL